MVHTVQSKPNTANSFHARIHLQAVYSNMPHVLHALKDLSFDMFHWIYQPALAFMSMLEENSFVACFLKKY